MKRQKRDRLERAHQRGYQAGIAGRSKETGEISSVLRRVILNMQAGSK
jgi:ribosome modulation factor